MKWKTLQRPALSLLLSAVVFVCAGCQGKPAASKNVFPGGAEAPGWMKTGEIRTFAAAELYNYIDGGAEKYLKAGVRSVSTADYKFKDEIPVVVDVYTMSTPDGPKAIFESEPAAGAQEIALGDSGRLYAQSLVFRRGPYLVRMVAYQASPQLPQGMVEFGHALEKKLPR